MAIQLKFKTNVTLDEVPLFIEVLQKMGIKYSIRKAKPINKISLDDMKAIWLEANVSIEPICIAVYKNKVVEFFAEKIPRSCPIVSKHPAYLNCLTLAVFISGLYFDNVDNMWFLTREDFSRKHTPYFAKIGKWGYLVWTRKIRNDTNSV